MKLNKTKLAAAVATIIFADTSYSASETVSGSSPKGKPFVQIADEIVVVQGVVATLEDQVEELIGDVESLEGRISAAENAITELNNNKTTIQAQIDELYDTAHANGIDIQSLQNQLTALQEQLSLLESQGSTNTDEIASLKGQIDTINGLIATNADGLAGLLVDLTTTMEKLALLNSQVELMETELATKQKIISGQCNPGEFVKLVNPDGSVVCGTDQVGGSGHLEGHSVNSVKTLPGGYYESYTYSCGTWGTSTCTGSRYVPAPIVTVQQACTPGYALTGGGYSNAGGTFTVLGVQNILGAVNKYQVTAQSSSSNASYIALQAVCLGIVP